MSKINKIELKQIFNELKIENKIGFEKLYSQYNNLVYKIAFTILKNRQDSEDVTSIVFEKIIKMNKKNLPENNEASWLYTVTKNESINYFKKKFEYINLENIYEIKDNDNEINNIIDQIEFNNMIRKLNKNEKEIVSLKVLTNLTFNEIGKLLNKSTGTVKWIYYKAINKLKILLSNLGMFIITFITGMKLLFNKEEIIVDDITDNNNTGNSTQTKEENKINTELLENDNQNSTLQDTNKSYNNIEEEKNDNKEIKEEVINQEDIQLNNINYTGLGFLGLSIIFLIIFITLLIKYQLKGRKKLSK